MNAERMARLTMLLEDGNASLRIVNQCRELVEQDPDKKQRDLGRMMLARMAYRLGYRLASELKDES